MLVKVLQENQEKLKAYIKDTYTNVQVFVQESWLALDFNRDGKLDMDDLRKEALDFHEFVKEFDNIDSDTRINSKMYNDASKSIQSDN